MISISKPKLKQPLLIISLILIIAAGSLYAVLAIPAPNSNSVCEPGGCGQSQYDYYVRYDTGGTTVIVQDGHNGGNVCSSASSSSDIAINCAVNLVCNDPSWRGGSGIFTSPQGETIGFGAGDFFLSAPVTVSCQRPITFEGEGQLRTTIQLNNNINTDMFDILCSAICSIPQFWHMLIEGNSQNNAGPSNCIFINANSAELEVFDVQIRDCVTTGINAKFTGINWNSLNNVWFLNDGIGLLASQGDWRITGSRFEGNTVAGIENNVSATTGMWTVTGNIFFCNTCNTGKLVWWHSSTGNAVFDGNVYFGNGATGGNFQIDANPGPLDITGSQFYNTQLLVVNHVSTLDIAGNSFTNYGTLTAIQFADYGATSFVDYVTVEANTFVDLNAGGKGVYIGNNRDNYTLNGNNFSGLTRANSISYGTGTKLNVYTRDNSGYNPFGKITNFVLGSAFAVWGTSSTVVASTAYKVSGMDMIITSTGGTGVSITIQDVAGNTVTGLSALATITAQGLPPGYTINFGAFSVAPTVTVFGV